MQCRIVVTDVISDPAVILAVGYICVVPDVFEAFGNGCIGIILAFANNLAIKLDEWSSNPKAVSTWQRFIRIVTLQMFCARRKNRTTTDVIHVTHPDDDDVLAEEERVLSGGANQDLIVLSQLKKVYDNGKVAVKNLSFGIPPGQCFGLLGINGAGTLL